MDGQNSPDQQNERIEPLKSAYSAKPGYESGYKSPDWQNERIAGLSSAYSANPGYFADTVLIHPADAILPVSTSHELQPGRRY